MITLPILPSPVRLMFEGLNLSIRIARTQSAAELAAERAYGFVLGIETVNAVTSDTVDRLYAWVNATYAEAIDELQYDGQ